VKVLITGANGQLGHELTSQLSQKGMDLLLTDVDKLDITSRDKVFDIVKQSRPDIIINCAAHTSVDKCETDKDNAFKINALGPKYLSQAANSIGAEIVQVSTDYVFDGEGNTPLTEFDHPNPQTVYGETKLYGERLVTESNPKHYIIRTAWLYGDGNNFVKTMISLSKTTKSIKVVNDQFGTPTSTVDLSKAIIKLTEEKNYGLFHGSCIGQCSWYDFAKKVFSLLNKDIEVIPCTTMEFPRPAKRPKYSVLRNYMLELTGKDEFRQWEDSLKEYILKIQI
jgi:dTDP-4-dehydrorhamnose reductase